MDRRQITNYVNLTALILYIAGACYSHGHSTLDRFRNHDSLEHLDHYPLERERQDVELYLCGLPRIGRTLPLRIIKDS